MICLPQRAPNRGGCCAENSSGPRGAGEGDNTRALGEGCCLVGSRQAGQGVGSCETTENTRGRARECIRRLYVCSKLCTSAEHDFRLSSLNK